MICGVRCSSLVGEEKKRREETSNEERTLSPVQSWPLGDQTPVMDEAEDVEWALLYAFYKHFPEHFTCDALLTFSIVTVYLS